ncbi:MAG: HAD hydrolase-like protein, partial [Bacteroidales bacterium]|nr:HAD hydrolase-like protein [Bacteroidales bacterium]
KPDPEIVEQIMACVPSLKKQDVVYSGDSNVDMQTGLNAGVRTIGVLWGFRTREELAAYNPSALVSSAAQLTDEILRS